MQTTIRLRSQDVEWEVSGVPPEKLSEYTTRLRAQLQGIMPRLSPTAAATVAVLQAEPRLEPARAEKLHIKGTVIKPPERKSIPTHQRDGKIVNRTVCNVVIKAEDGNIYTASIWGDKEADEIMNMVFLNDGLEAQGDLHERVAKNGKTYLDLRNADIILPAKTEEPCLPDPTQQAAVPDEEEFPFEKSTMGDECPF